MPTLHQESETGVSEEQWLRHKVLAGLSRDEKLASSIERPTMSAERREVEMDKLVLTMIDVSWLETMVGMIVNGPEVQL